MIFTGKIRNDLTMEWSTVAVKSGKTERDDNFLLESLLTELKILASLPKPHDSIINLRGAYTKMLHQRKSFKTKSLHETFKQIEKNLIKTFFRASTCVRGLL